ncbi:MAG: homoserine dehydrogenase [Selenomonadaceae bacterium]|nr:homoserine dehydrogenase [Selenomonadaceae bacterium]
MTDTIKIGLLGAGTVGSGVIKVLRENAAAIKARVGTELVIAKVLVRDAKKTRPELTGLAVVEDVEEILQDPSISVVVEVMGGTTPSKDYMLRAMEAGKSVVTANKDVVAEYGQEMFAMAEKHRVAFLFEASVGGGIPIIAPLKRSLTANRLTEVMGIVNGTTNYMLTRMAEAKVGYEQALQEAQAKGYAEADPTADVAGMDAARKAAILASLAFNTRISLRDVYVEGITRITADDISYASDLGYAVKLLAVGQDISGKGVSVRVHPVFLPQNHPLAAVNGVYNAIFLKGNAIGEAMFYGPGAGSLPTASAVVADIIEAARAKIGGSLEGLGCTCYAAKPLCPIAEIESCYYVRLWVDDEPGVLGNIATAFGNAQVSLKSVIQTKPSVEGRTEIVAITHLVEHRKLNEALASLRELKVVDDIRNVIRVEKDRG